MNDKIDISDNKGDEMNQQKDTVNFDEEVIKETNSEKEKNMEMADKTSAIFYGTANVYLADFEVVKKIYYVLTALVIFVTAIMFRNHIIIDMVIVTGLGLFFYAGQNKLISDLFKIFAQYNTVYKENANYLKKLLSSNKEENTYNSISFNSKTLFTDKGVDKKSWNYLVKSELFSEKFNINLQTILEEMETIETISSLKEEREKLKKGLKEKEEKVEKE